MLDAKCEVCQRTVLAVGSGARRCPSCRGESERAQLAERAIALYHATIGRPDAVIGHESELTMSNQVYGRQAACGMLAALLTGALPITIVLVKIEGYLLSHQQVIECKDWRAPTPSEMAYSLGVYDVLYAAKPLVEHLATEVPPVVAEVA